MDYDLIAVDWSGIGDAVCHSRLMLQHLLPKKILWMTTPTVYPLFKDDPMMDYMEGWNGQRGVGPQHESYLLEMDCKLKYLFKRDDVFCISANVIRNFIGTSGNLSEIFFKCNGIKRDYSIKHSLVHNTSNTISPRYIVLEHCASSGPENLEQYQNLVNRLKSKFDIVLVGAKNDPLLDGVIDMRGTNLYDTFAFVKHCSTFIGRSSGNQSLMCFLPNIPLIEINVRDPASYINCQLHPNVQRIDSPDELTWL